MLVLVFFIVSVVLYIWTYVPHTEEVQYTNILELETQVQQRTDAHQAEIDTIDAEINELTLRKKKDKSNFDSQDKDRLKTLRGDKITKSTEFKQWLAIIHKKLADAIIEWLYHIDRQRDHTGRLPEYFHNDVRRFYLLLNDCGAPRYKKLPVDWIPLGLIGGILEDLIVILRVPTGDGGIGMGNKHVYTIDEVIVGYHNFRNTESPDKISRFPCLNYIFEIYHNTDDIKHAIKMVVRHQGDSMRIGTLLPDRIYAIQGIYNVPFDPRVVTVLTPDSFNDPSTPCIGVHFTTTEIATAIWNETPTNDRRGKPLDKVPIGCIMRFKGIGRRDIHALSCVHYDDTNECYRINHEFIGIKDRMTHGISTNWNRPKYQSGLVLDIQKIVNTLPAGSVMLNEIGTLLVTETIPRECIIACINTDELIDKFWHIE